MRIHQCARCEGCGYVAGGFRWEIPWSRWANPLDPMNADGVLEANPCPDCAGTGALMELEGSTVTTRLASRRGLPRDGYADHVAAILQNRSYD